jgi:hypothetical protein
MQTLIPLIFIGLFAYLMFSRRGGGMGCCGSHGGHGTESSQRSQSEKSINENTDSVIDLKKDEYTILPSNDERRPRCH